MAFGFAKIHEKGNRNPATIEKVGLTINSRNIKLYEKMRVNQGRPQKYFPTIIG